MVCRNFETNQEEYQKNWGFGLFSFGDWLYLSRQVAGALEKHTVNMCKSSRVFSDQLTEGYMALFVIDRIIKYAEQGEASKFKMTVQVLFH